VTPQTVSKWRARFVEQRLDGLLDAPRPGAPRTIEDTHVDAVIAKTLESVPDGATHWSTRSMAREAGLSQTAVSRIWRAFGLQPHRQERAGPVDQNRFLRVISGPCVVRPSAEG
jgi:hypothetical protein